MADHIPAWLTSYFSSNVQHVLQDKGGRLRSAVSFKGGYKGKQASPVNFLGPTEPVETNERYGDTPHMDLNHMRRWIFPRKFHWGHLVETDDELYSGIDPTGDYTQAAVNGFQRAEDRVILASFFRDARIGETGAETEVWSDAGSPGSPGYVVGVNVGGANTGLNLEKLREVRRLFQYYNVDLDSTEIHMAISEEEEQDLLTLDRVNSFDYTNTKPIGTGRLPPILGINFHLFSSQTLETVTATAEVGGNTRSLPVWVKDGVHLGSWKDRDEYIMRNPAKQMKPHIYMDHFYDATRLELGKVLKVNVYHA